MCRVGVIASLAQLIVGCRLMLLMSMEPDNEKIYFNLGMLSMDDRKFDQAKQWFDKAIEVYCVVYFIRLRFFKLIVHCEQN